MADELKLIVQLDPATPRDVLEHIISLLEKCRPYVITAEIQVHDATSRRDPGLQIRR